jgi:hypothetical protein
MTEDPVTRQAPKPAQKLPVCSFFWGAAAVHLQCGITAGGRPEAASRLRQDRQQKIQFAGCFLRERRLEPATSGVTGRSWRFRPGRGQAGIPGASRAFHTWSCGDCRAPAGTCGDLVRDQRGMLRCPSCNQRGVWGRCVCSSRLGRLPSDERTLAQPSAYGFSQTEMCLALAAVNGLRAQSLQRSRSLIPAIRAIRSSSAGHM